VLPQPITTIRVTLIAECLAGVAHGQWSYLAHKFPTTVGPRPHDSGARWRSSPLQLQAQDHPSTEPAPGPPWPPRAAIRPAQSASEWGERHRPSRMIQ